MPAHKSQDGGDFEQWSAARRANLGVVKTTTTPRGQILDWVPIESQTPNGVIAIPPALEPPVHLDGHRAAQFEYATPGLSPAPQDGADRPSHGFSEGEEEARQSPARSSALCETSPRSAGAGGSHALWLFSREPGRRDRCLWLRRLHQRLGP